MPEPSHSFELELQPVVHRGFTIEVGHSGCAALPRAAWARHDKGYALKALGQTDREAKINVKIEIDKFWDSK